MTQPKLGTFLGRSRLLKYTRVPLTIVRPKDLQSITNTPGSGGGGGGSSSGDCCGRFGVSGGGVAYASVAWSVAVVAISYFLVGVSYFLVGVFVADGGDMDKDMLSSQCWGANGEIG